MLSVFGSEGYHLFLLVIYLFRRKRNLFEDCTGNKLVLTDVLIFKTRLGNWKHRIVERLSYERWAVNLSFGLMTAVAF
jgi:hypothetical protein